MSQDLGSAASSMGTSAKGKTGPKASPVCTDCFLKTGLVNILLFSLLDLKTSSGAPEQELTLHTTFRV